ncbi:MAG: 2-hydroxyacyl-CoA dehydratase [Chloroflexi bacterium]|nr:2-hydroxyacyl-CoA dehydratase [Chloroflexota bacterium]
MSKFQYQRWETRPLQCWTKAKEIRRNYEKARIHAAEEKKLLVDGRDASIFTALGDLQSVMTNPLGAMIANSSNEFARKCHGAAECAGFGREICGYHRNIFGSMLLNRDYLGAPFPRRDISIPTPAPCDQHAKRGQPVADYFGIPRFQGEWPMYSGEQDPERDEVMIDHRVNEILDQIEFLEKTTGRRFDDGVFKEQVLSTMRLRKLAGEVYCLNQSIPAPLDQKSIYSLYTLGDLVRGDQDATETLWQELRDEVQWRVDNKVAAVGTERYRWVEEEPPPWAFLKYYRYMEKYGAVCVGSPYAFMLGAPFEWREDGTYRSKKTPLELGWPMNTREELVRANLTTFVLCMGYTTDMGERITNMLDIAKAYHADGSILPLHRAGVGCVWGKREAALALVAAGVSVTHYESPQPGDRTDLDDNRFLDQLDHWMESQGLRKLED